jgi:hypothetical protein
MIAATKRSEDPVEPLIAVNQPKQCEHSVLNALFVHLCVPPILYAVV